MSILPSQGTSLVRDSEPHVSGSGDSGDRPAIHRLSEKLIMIHQVEWERELWKVDADMV